MGLAQRDRPNSISLDSGGSTPSSTGGNGRKVSLSGLRQHLGVSSSSAASPRPYFTHDSGVMQEAHELLGTSVSPLSHIMIACMSGEEEIAQDLLDFVYKQTFAKKQKLLLLEFLGKVWGMFCFESS